MPAYKYLGHNPSDFPVASSYQEQILSLPMYPEISQEQIEHVADCIRKFHTL
jgi:dTDP-4-amino-4,6-dideoxygalactose transaminase